MWEEEMIRQLLARNEQGLETLMAHYEPLMRYIIAPILPDAQDREDGLSEVVLRVWEKIPLYDPQRGSFRAWLTALTRNTALNRQRYRASEQQMQEIPDSTPSPEPTPEDAVLQQEQRAALQRVLEQMSDRDRALFYRKYYYLQSTTQIASELGMTPRAVEGRLYRLKRQLHSWLGGDKHA